MTGIGSGIHGGDTPSELAPALLDDLSDLIIELDAQDQIVGSNLAARHFWPELASKRLSPVRFSDLVTVDPKQETERKAAICRRSGRTIDFLMRSRPRDGTLIIAKPHCNLSSSALMEREELLSLAEESSGIGVWDIDVASDTVKGTPQFFRLHGLPPTPEPVPMATLRALRLPIDSDAINRRYAEKVKQGDEIVETEYRIAKPDGGEKWIFGRGRVIRDAKGEPVRYSGIDIDITDRRQAERALRESEARFRNMADHAPVMIWMSDEKGNCTFLSRSWYEFTGMENGDGLGKGWLMAIHPGDRERRQHLLASDAARDSVELEYRLLNAEGEYRWVLEKVTPRHGDDHAPLGYIGSILDITERKHSEDHIRFLMREVNHRAKNLLAVVRAIARQTAAHTEASAFTPRFDERLSGLAASYDLLVHNRWQGVDIADLAKAQLAHFADLIGERISLQGEPFRLSASAAQNLGLALNELSTNAAKYGALSTLSGRLEIVWRVEENSDHPRFVLSWQEIGGPPVSQPARRGLGHRLTTGFIEQALDGKVELHYAAEGLHWRLTAPRDRLEKTESTESDHGQE